MPNLKYSVCVDFISMPKLNKFKFSLLIFLIIIMNIRFMYIPLYYGGIVGFKYAANFKLKYKFDKET